MFKYELSDKNDNYINKYRMYELKYHCLQYHNFVKARRELYEEFHYGTGEFDDPTGFVASSLADLNRSIKEIEMASYYADKELQPYILRAVTDGLTYQQMFTRCHIPCCREVFYDRCRKFYRILSDMKGL